MVLALLFCQGSFQMLALAAKPIVAKRSYVIIQNFAMPALPSQNKGARSKVLLTSTYPNCWHSHIQEHQYACS